MLKNLLVLIIFSGFIPMAVYGSGNSNYMEIINAKKEFIEFWKQAKEKSFEERKALFAKDIESIDPEFYLNTIWQAELFPNKWKSLRDESLRGLFSIYEKNSLESIANAYDLYDKIFRETILKFEKRLPDYDNSTKIMMVPGVTWGGSYIEDKNEYLALGIDWYLKQETPLAGMQDLLIVHELFHDYHAQIRGTGIDMTEYVKTGKLFWQLWDEGMATWGVGYVFNEQTVKRVMPDSKNYYANYKQCHDAGFAKKFIDEFDNKAVDLENKVNVKKWFGGYGDARFALGKDTPPMLGYYLGWRVIKKIEESGIPPKTFLSWSYKEARPHILAQLEAISHEPACK